MLSLRPKNNVDVCCKVEDQFHWEILSSAKCYFLLVLRELYVCLCCDDLIN